MEPWTANLLDLRLETSELVAHSFASLYYGCFNLILTLEFVVTMYHQYQRRELYKMPKPNTAVVSLLGISIFYCTISNGMVAGVGLYDCCLYGHVHDPLSFVCMSFGSYALAAVLMSLMYLKKMHVSLQATKYRYTTLIYKSLAAGMICMTFCLFSTLAGMIIDGTRASVISSIPMAVLSFFMSSALVVFACVAGFKIRFRDQGSEIDFELLAITIKYLVVIGVSLLTGLLFFAVINFGVPLVNETDLIQMQVRGIMLDCVLTMLCLCLRMWCGDEDCCTCFYANMIIDSQNVSVRLFVQKAPKPAGLTLKNLTPQERQQGLQQYVNSVREQEIEKWKVDNADKIKQIMMDNPGKKVKVI